MLRAFADESEQAVYQMYGVAGFLWEDEAAVEFDERWRAALKAWGINEFHMAPFESSKGEFTGWSTATKVSRLQQLHEIINETIFVGVWTTLDVAAFDALSANEKYLLGDPYINCTRTFVARVAEYLTKRRGIPQPVDYVLDDRDGKGRLMNEFDYFRSQSELKDKLCLGTTTWGSSLDITQLQAADTLVYEMTKQKARELGRETRPMRKSLWNLIEKNMEKYGGIHVGPNNLQALLNGV